MEAKFTDNLPQFAYTAQQVRKFEAKAAQNKGISLYELMHKAAYALLSVFDHHYISAEKIVILSGKGNNAGDGFLLASLLLKQGRHVLIYGVFDFDLLSGDAKLAYEYALENGVEFTHTLPNLNHYDVIVDAVFGVGFKDTLSQELSTLFTACKQSKAKRISIDVPSGVNATSSQVSSGAFEADITVTFIALKQGLLTGSAKLNCGTLLYASLDLEQAFAALTLPASQFLSQSAIFHTIPVRALDSYKNQCGHVLLIGGNKGMPGAIRLAAEACLRAGAGLVSVATHPDNVAIVQHGRFELMVHGCRGLKELDTLLDKATTLVIGPGLGQDSWSKSLFNSCKDFSGPVVCDADALNLIASQKSAPFKRCVLTPHLGEAKRLSKDQGVTLNNRFEVAKHISNQYQATIVLKGPGSLICKDKRLNINRSGCAAMASAGMGDVLSGIIGALLAQGMAEFEATQLAVYIHGLAAQIAAKEGEKGLLASDLFYYIKRLLE